MKLFSMTLKKAFSQRLSLYGCFSLSQKNILKTYASLWKDFMSQTKEWIPSRSTFNCCSLNALPNPVFQNNSGERFHCPISFTTKILRTKRNVMLRSAAHISYVILQKCVTLNKAGNEKAWYSESKPRQTRKNY